MDVPAQGCRLIVYGRHSCGRSHWLYEELMENQIDFEWRDIVMGEPRYRDELMELAHGCLSVPTVIFPDGSVMIEPRPDQVMNRWRQIQESTMHAGS